MMYFYYDDEEIPTPPEDELEDEEEDGGGLNLSDEADIEEPEEEEDSSSSNDRRKKEKKDKKEDGDGNQSDQPDQPEQPENPEKKPEKGKSGETNPEQPSKQTQDVADQLQQGKNKPSDPTDPTSKPGEGGPKKPGGDTPGGKPDAPGGKPDMPGGKPGAPGGQDLAKKGGEEAAKKATQEAGKQVAKEGVKQAGTQAAAHGAAAGASAGAAAGGATAAGGTAATAATAATPVGWVILIIIAVILLIMIIIGVVFFFLAMPGQIIAKAKELGVKVMDAFTSVVKGKEDVIHTKDMAEVANYLENMGYDLKGEGFVSSDKTESDVKDNQYLDVAQGVVRDNDTGKVTDLNSDPIMTYMVSDNLCYIVKNFNQNLDAATGGNGEDTFNAFGILVLFVGAVTAILLSPIAAIAAVVAITAGSYLAFVTANNQNWGTGLISIWHEDSMGVKGKPYNVKERGSIELTPETKKMKIKRGWTGAVYTYDVDGWGGQYGMPLEFLLSVHAATQMPDLAMNMATAFDTDVEVLLHKVEAGEIDAGFVAADGSTVTYSEVYEAATADNNVVEDIWNWLCGAVESLTGYDTDSNEAISLDDSALEVMHTDLHLPHDPDNCTCFDADGNYVSECSACKQYIRDIIAAMQEVNKDNTGSYTPYISQVKDHWFRDVYFVRQSPSSTEVTQVDEDYFYLTEERWSVYETYSDSDTIPEGFEVGDYKLYEYDNGTYTLSTRTKEEVDKLNEDLEAGDLDAVRLIKKPVSKTLTANYDGIWSAYDIEDYADETWQLLPVNDDSPDIIKKFEGHLKYKAKRPGDIYQVEDGERGVTNEKIKNMFVNNLYYQYDGTTTRADAISEDRQNTDRAKDNTSNDERNKDLLGRVALGRDSLGAFSMLENTHTLDADYVYKNFKELIVELNYFDKEDLSNKIQEIMQWPIPECGSSGWPIRQYEKGEDYYGTLINSKVDITLMRDADIEKAKKLMDQITNEDGSSSSADVNPTGKVASGSVKDLVDKGYEVHGIMETAKGSGGWDYCVIRPADCTHTYGHSCGLDSTIQEAQAGHHNTCCATYVSWVLKEAGFDLSNHPNMHGAKSSYDWCVAEGWTPITTYGELEPGDLLFNKHDYEGSDTNMIGHVQMLGNNGEWLNAGSVSAINDAPKAYTAKFIIGMRSQMSGAKELFEGYEPDQAVVAPITGKILEYGIEGGTGEHAPVKRKNVETGEEEEVEWIKIQAVDSFMYHTKGDGTSYDDGRGFLKCTKINDKEYDSFEDKASDADKQHEGYDYFYEEYQNVCDGYILYIEGFDLTAFDSDGSKALFDGGDKDSEDVTRYIENEVYNMTDNLKEARAIWREDAKASADAYWQIGEDLYIKEGTVIGKTLEDPEIDESKLQTRTSIVTGEEENSYPGNGNYIRLIFRDLEDAIVEDVESYMPLDEKQRTEVDWEFFYWLPYESGPLDGDGNGPEACGTVSGPTEVAAGIAQWTSYGSGCNNIPELCKWVYEKDPSLCSPLAAFTSYSSAQIASNLSDLQSAWALVCQKDRDGFLKLQMDYFYEHEFMGWVESAGVEWLLDKSLVAQGTYASLKNWGPNLGWESVINASMSDEEIVKALLTKACPISSTCGTLDSRWNSQYVLAKDILSGTFADVEEWVRTKQPSDKYGEGQNQGVLALILERMNILVDPTFLAIVDKK